MAMQMCEKYLVYVDANTAGGKGNNKFYRMIPDPDGNTWTAEWGRIGATPQRKTKIPARDFEKKYNEKIKKNYKDQTELMAEVLDDDAGDDGYKPITNRVIAEIVRRLQEYANVAIKQNYTVSATKVTMAMVDEAQKILEELVNIKDLAAFNAKLNKLFVTIPRQMTRVKDYMADSDADYNKIIHREQDLLDVMKGQVSQKAVKPAKKDTENKQTILEALGLVFEECNDDDIAKIKAALGKESEGKLRRAWRVTNLKTQQRYDEYVASHNITNTKLLFHGSRNENWWSIINGGLVLRPTNAIINGKMFGYGLYFAPRARKSIGYTSLSGSYWARGSSNVGYMALQEVAYGVPYDVHSFDSRFYNFNYQRLRQAKPDADCLHAHAGSMLQNDEIIIYDEAQTTIKYLIEIAN